MSYTPIFTKPYADGYKNRPDRSTPVTAEIKNKETETLLAIEAYLAELQIPEKLSELTNDEGFIKNTVTNLANYYLKTETYARTETYTREEVQSLIADAVAKVSGKLNIFNGNIVMNRTIAVIYNCLNSFKLPFNPSAKICIRYEKDLRSIKTFNDF